MYSSVYFSRKSSTIHYWEYDENGKKVYKKDKAPLYFYMKNENGEYTSIYGDKLKKIEFDEFEKYKNAKEMFKSAGHELFESDISIENRFILDKYSNLDIKIPKYNIYFIDIEVHSETGFPTPEKAEHPITIITIYSTKYEKYYILAEKEFNTEFLPKNVDVKFFNGNEQELLSFFIKFIRKTHPDVISGWNSNPFDIPYIINRCYQMLGEEHTNKLSPVHQIRKITRKTRWGLPYEIYQIMGINCIDYLELYRKYEAGERGSYKLDFIAELELGESKLKFEGSLKELYKNNWQKYCEYNFTDVELLVKLDKRKQFFNLLFTICCSCNVPFEQYDKTVRVLDGAFISKLIKSKTILPDSKEPDENGEKFEGAFVFPTIPGAYDWVVSFDATSLYPSCIIQHNISPETKMFVVNKICVEKIYDLLESKQLSEQELNYEAYNGKTVKEIVDIIKEKKYSIAPNGTVYKHDKIGIVPTFVQEWFDKRQYHKKLMKKAKDAGDVEETMKQDGLQYNYKILINSVFGALGSKYCRLYDVHNAEAITKTGQEAIKSAMNSVNNFFQNKWEKSVPGIKINAKNTENLIICGDTDSLYIDVGQILRSFSYANINDVQKCKTFIDKQIVPLLNNIIQPTMERLAKVRMNVPDNKIFFKREMIAKKAIFLCKKNYVAWVVNMEGIDVKDVENPNESIKAKGIELVKSSFSKNIKDLMKEYIFDLVHHCDYYKSNLKMKELKQKFKNLTIEEIAKIGNIKEFNKYLDFNGEPIKGATGPAKSSAGYNAFLKKLNLENIYEPILEGDKIKLVYIKECPFYKFSAIAFKNKFPKEFNLNDYVDYDIMYEKVLQEPLKRFYDALKWQMPNLEQEDILDLFN